MKKNTTGENFLIVFGAVALIGFVALILALPTMWLWNWLMPKIFGLITINFWQALGINLLSSILFKSSSSSSSNK